MAEPVASFGIEIADESAEGVNSSTKNLEKLRAQVDADTQALAAMQKALKNINGGTVVNVAQFKQLKQQIADTKIQIASGTSKLLSMGGSLKMAKPEAAGASVQIENLKKALLEANGPVGALSGRIGGLITKLGSAGLVGVAVAATAAYVALAAAIGIVTAKLAKFGVVETDNYRTEALSMAALTKIPDLWGRAAGKWQQMTEIVNSSAQAWGLSRAKVSETTQSLYMAGYRGNALRNAVEGTSIALAAFNGDTEKANRYLGMMSWQFGFLGKGTTAFAARVKRDLGDIAIRQSLGFSKQMMMLRQNVGLLFSTLKIEGFLKGLNTVLSLFSETTVSGKLLKDIIGSMLNPLFGGAEGAGIAVKHMIQDMIFWVLKAQGAWLDLQIWVAKTFNFKGDLATVIALTSLKMALAGAAVVAGMLAIALTGIAMSGVVITAALGAIGATLVWVGSQFLWLYNYVSDVGWSELGYNIIKGIGEGFLSGVDLVRKAVKAVANSVVEDFKKTLGIRSPSIVFRNQARFVPAGAAIGIRQGIPQVRAAVREMVAVPPPAAFGASWGANFAPIPPPMAFGGQAMPMRQPEERQPVANTNNITFNVDGSKSPTETADAIKRMLEQILQGALTQAGAA